VLGPCFAKSFLSHASRRFMPRCLEQGTSVSPRETEGLHLSPGPVLDPNDARSTRQRMSASSVSASTAPFGRSTSAKRASAFLCRLWNMRNFCVGSRGAYTCLPSVRCAVLKKRAAAATGALHFCVGSRRYCRSQLGRSTPTNFSFVAYSRCKGQSS